MAGTIAADRCAQAGELVQLKTPFVREDGSRIYVTCHRAIKARFRLACKRAKNFSRFGSSGKVQRIDSFVCRSIRGSTTISNHGKGKAWDIFATGPGVPPPGGVWEPDETFGKQFARCFTDLGFTWGSQWQRQDWPHLEYSGHSVPRLTTRERLRTRKLAKQRWKEATD